MTDKTPTANLPSIVVISDINNRKFRMALKGSLERLSVAKIKSYLQQSTKVPASEQILQFHGATLQDNLVGGDFGLHHDAVLHMNSISNLQQQQQEHEQEHHYQSHQQQNSGTTPPPNLPDFHQKTTPGSPPPPPPQSTHYHQSASMEHGHHQYQHQQHVPSRPAPSVPGNDENNNNNNKRLADELAAIRTSLDSDKKKQQQQSYFSPSSSSASRQMNDEENVRPENTNKNTVHSATAESTIPESLLMASTRFGGKYYPSNKTSSPSRNNFGEASSSSSVPVPSSSPLSGMQIQSSLLVNENSQMKKEIDQLKGKIQALEAALQASNNTNDVSTTNSGGGFAPGGVLAAARAQLHGLSQELGMMDLSFDDNFTCVIGSDDSTVLLTVDPATERLYLYATLLESLDKIQDERKKNKIYRALLEWSMLGRDMAGGGVGIDASTGVVIMSTSIDLKNSKTPALRDTAPVFVESLVRWRQALNTLMTA